MNYATSKFVKTVSKTLVSYGPALFTCAASIYAVQHEDARNHKVAKEVAEMVMDEIQKSQKSVCK